MALGTLYFVAQGWNVRDPVQQEYYIVTIFVPAIAAASYFSMATGFGVIHIPAPAGFAESAVTMVDGQRVVTIYWARYADWLFTTPLLLVDLALLAGADRNTTATLVGLDVFMILTGLAGALSREGQAIRIVWWAISTGALLVLLYFLLGTLSEQAAARSAAAGELFDRLRNLTLVLWAVYPVLWLLGTESGIGAIPLGVETAAFAALDLAAKVGFGFLLLRSREVLSGAGVSDGTTAASVDD
jgi:bacteriorhodopsin